MSKAFPSRSELRDQKRVERDKEQAIKTDALRAEEQRKAALTFWEAIDELEVSRDLRDILHRLANGERE